MFLFVVHDGPAVTRALGVLSRLGARGSKIVDSAPRAIEYLATIQAGTCPRPEAIILDHVLRIGSGLDVLAEMNKGPSIRDIPVVVWTNAFNEAQRKTYIDLKVYEFLIRTRNGKELRAAILRLRNVS